MVHFMGHDLLVLAPKNDEYVGGHILKTGMSAAAAAAGSSTPPTRNTSMTDMQPLLVQCGSVLHTAWQGITTLREGLPALLKVAPIDCQWCVCVCLIMWWVICHWGCVCWLASLTHAGTPFSPHLLGPLLDLIALRPGSTVVDVGANIGSFSIFFAATTGPSGRVYSFEPQRKMYQVRDLGGW